MSATVTQLRPRLNLRAVEPQRLPRSARFGISWRVALWYARRWLDARSNTGRALVVLVVWSAILMALGLFRVWAVNQ